MKCVVVTRHKLLPLQEEDIKSICSSVDIVEQLPDKPEELAKVLQPYDVVIGNLPIALYQSIMQLKKKVYRFNVKAVKVTKDLKEVEEFKNKYGNLALVQTPNREGESYRLNIYDGIEEIIKIEVVTKPVISHSS